MLYPWALSPPGGISETNLALAQQLKGSKILPWGLELYSLGCPGANWGVGIEGTGETINVEGKSTSRKPPGKKSSGFSPKQKTIRAGQKCRDPVTPPWFYRGETEVQKGGVICSGTLDAID